MPVPPPATPPLAEAARTGDADPLDRVLRIQPWPDPVVDDHGHDPRSAYVERFWLPVLGPSTCDVARGSSAWFASGETRFAPVSHHVCVSLRRSRVGPARADAPGAGSCPFRGPVGCDVQVVAGLDLCCGTQVAA